jgi:quinol monooxygenase YgiN
MKRMAIMTALLVVAVGCGDDASGSDGEGAGNPGGEGGGSGEPVDPYAHLYACEDSAFTEAKPLSGPGYDPVTGFTGTPLATYVVSATQIYVRPEQQNAFFEQAGKVVAQLGETPGLVAFGLGTDSACGDSRTIGVWESEDALYEFVGSGAHLTAMQMANELGFTGRTTHWNATSEEVKALTWQGAREKLAAVESGY